MIELSRLKGELVKTPRATPPPDDLLREVKKVVASCANTQEDKTDDFFFSRETWKACFDFIGHVKKGCVSVKPGFNCCCCSAADGEKSALCCIQGTSKLEGFHEHSRQILPATRSSPLLALCLLALRSSIHGIMEQLNAGCAGRIRRSALPWHCS